MDELIRRLEELHVTLPDLEAALDGKDNWGHMVHAALYLTVLSAVKDGWRASI